MSKRTQIIALITTGMVLLTLAVIPSDANAKNRWPTPPKAQKTIIHKSAFKQCAAMSKLGRCFPVRFRSIYKKKVNAYWTREWNRRERNFDYALQKAAARYGVSYSWLKMCNRNEGGAGHWKWNGSSNWYLYKYPTRPAGSSGAGGPMQFMEGTYKAYAQHRKVARILPSHYQGTRGWKKRAGQAFVAAYMFSINEDKQWTGHGCNR